MPIWLVNWLRDATAFLHITLYTTDCTVTEIWSWTTYCSMPKDTARLRILECAKKACFRVKQRTRSVVPPTTSLQRLAKSSSIVFLITIYSCQLLTVLYVLFWKDPIACSFVVVRGILRVSGILSNHDLLSASFKLLVKLLVQYYMITCWDYVEDSQRERVLLVAPLPMKACERHGSTALLLTSMSFITYSCVVVLFYTKQTNEGLLYRCFGNNHWARSHS